MKYTIICLLLLALSFPAQAAQSKKIYGLYERVMLPVVSQSPIEAKLDTGAQTSSLGADNIELFEKDGKTWVRFTPQLQGAKRMELPLARNSRIKRRADGSGATQSIERPVVVMEICFDGQRHSIEVNLADRSRFSFPLLLGSRAMVTFGAVIDPALEYTFSAGCK